MRFLVDECTGTVVAQWLRDRSHDVFSIYEQARGMSDDEILLKAYTENWIVITFLGCKMNARPLRLTRLKNCLTGTKISWQTPLL